MRVIGGRGRGGAPVCSCVWAPTPKPTTTAPYAIPPPIATLFAYVVPCRQEPRAPAPADDRNETE